MGHRNISRPNLANDNIAFDIIVNDTTDVWIREVAPARGAPNYVQQSGQYLSKFPYGEHQSMWSLAILVG